jgi:RNA-directed DNA polymerase
VHGHRLCTIEISELYVRIIVRMCAVSVYTVSVHRLIYNALYPYFDSRFFYDSYSCRLGKGTHRARDQFRSFAQCVSRNYTKPCFILKFDIKKCFASVNLATLKRLLRSHMVDDATYNLLEIIVDSFEGGLPLGNLTSQLFINVYLHELDHCVKHDLNVPHYIRYADDVLIVDQSPKRLGSLFENISGFLAGTLSLQTHKVHVRSIYSGIDVLGEVFFADYKRLRRSTKRRAKRRTLYP